MNVFERIFKALNKAKIEYLVVGGVAVNLYGYPRFTGDLDILVVLDEENLVKIDNTMRKLGYSERLPVSILSLKDNALVKKWLKEKNLKAYTFNPPANNFLQIDIIIEESLKFASFKKSKVIKKFGTTAIPVVSVEDLITMKKKYDFDTEMVKRWKKTSTKAKLIWLESALEFGMSMKNPKVDAFLASSKKR